MIGSHLMETQRDIYEINLVMVADFHLYYIAVFLGYLLLYLCLFGMLARTV